jgi:dTDP-4-amino-4,6-dideoxygalactose transaminase
MNEKKQIPMLDTSQEVELLWDQLNAAFQSVLRSGQFIMGKTVHEFEQQIAAYLGVNHAVAMNSGTDALVIGLRALNLEPGDEVITSPFSFFATAEAISLIGAKPVFVDIDPQTFNLDVTRIKSAITPRTRVILPVHLYGQSADLDPILSLCEQHDLKLLEDAAQVFGGEYKGRRAGTIGHAAAFSFFPSKNLGAYGDAGMLTTNDANVAETARRLRTHGASKKYHNQVIGYNSRMDSLQAAILSVKLPYVAQWVEARREAARFYDRLLTSLPDVVTPYKAPYAKHAYHQYTIRVKDGKRDRIQEYMRTAGIATAVYYPVPIHRMPMYDYAPGMYPSAEKASSEVLSLPLWPQIGEEKQKRVVQALYSAIEACVSDRVGMPV